MVYSFFMVKNKTKQNNTCTCDHATNICTQIPFTRRNNTIYLSAHPHHHLSGSPFNAVTNKTTINKNEQISAECRFISLEQSIWERIPLLYTKLPNIYMEIYYFIYFYMQYSNLFLIEVLNSCLSWFPYWAVAVIYTFEYKSFLRHMHSEYLCLH